MCQRAPGFSPASFTLSLVKSQAPALFISSIAATGTKKHKSTFEMKRCLTTQHRASDTSAVRQTMTHTVYARQTRVCVCVCVCVCMHRCVHVWKHYNMGVIINKVLVVSTQQVTKNRVHKTEATTGYG